MNQSHRRLLDLLAGWAAFVDKCAEHGDSFHVTKEEYERESELIYNLYQRVGSWNQPTEVSVKQFLEEDLRDFLLYVL